MSHNSHTSPADEITVRPAVAADRDAVARIAERDSRPTPRGTLLVAEVAGEIRAAIALDDGATIADPFRPTAELVEMLRISARAAGAAARPAITFARSRRERLAFRSAA